MKLLNTINIYLVFHISLFESILSKTLNALFTEIELINPNAIYNIETILNYKYIRNKIKYLIKWLDYLYSKNIWEFKKDLSYPKKLQTFHLKYPHLPIRPQASFQIIKAIRD